MSDETISPEEQTDESETTQQNQDVEAQLKRALADYQNLQKRFEKEKQDVVRYANENLLLNMLGIIQGFEMMMKQFQDLLADQGFEKVQINAGDSFDPQKMDAIDGEGTVVDTVYSYPYKLHDKVVSHGRVSVMKK